MKRALILCGALVAGAASAQTYQVGQYLGNMSDINRLTYNTMGSAAQHANYSGAGANWTTLGSQNGMFVRTAGTASATIGGRTVPLTLISRVPVAGIANAARVVSLANPATAAVTLLGFAAMQGWLTPAGLEWNPDRATNLQQPIAMRVPDIESSCDITPQMQTNWTNWSTSILSNYNCAQYPNPPVMSVTTKHVKGEGNLCHLGANQTCMGITEFRSYAHVGMKDTVKEKLVPMTWDEAMPHLTNSGTGASHDFSAVDWKSIAEGLLQRGAKLPQPEDQTVSGPASTPGQKTTKQNADGTTTTTTTTNNYNYAGNTVTVTTTTNSTVTNNAGDVISNESETTEEGEEQAATDSALPGMPDLYERKYPNGIKGVWDEKMAAIKTSSLFGIVPGLTPNLGDGGCPVWTIPVDIGLIDFGTYDVSIPCSVWAFVRVVIILTAMFLARRLMFGG